VPAEPGRTGYEGPGPTLRQPHRSTANVPVNTAIVEHDRDLGTVHRERRWDLISPGAELGRSGPFFALSRPKRRASIASATAQRNRCASSHHIDIDEHEIDEHEIVSPTRISMSKIAPRCIGAEVIFARGVGRERVEKGPVRPSSAPGEMRSQRLSRLTVPRSQPCSTMTMLAGTLAVDRCGCLIVGPGPS